MAKNKKGSAHKSSRGLPVAPWIYINNSLNRSTNYAAALSALIPQSSVYNYYSESASIWLLHSNPYVICVRASYEASAPVAAALARGCQERARREGANMACITLCDGSTIPDFLGHRGKGQWPANHTTINVDCVSSEQVAKEIMKWLFTVLSVPETLYLIPRSEMLAIDTKNYPDYKYCPLSKAHQSNKTDKIQFVALIASKPEITEPNRLTWTVVDRSGEARFYFHHRGPHSQKTWDWVLALRPGDRRALPRMPMVALHEPIGKKLLLSPLRATGATIAGVGHLTMAVGKGVTWVGDKIRVPRREEDRYIEEPEAVEVVRRWRAGKQEREAAGKKGGGLGVRTRILRMVTGHYVCTGEGKCCDRKDMPIPDEKKKVSAGEKKLVIEEDFKIFNEKGEKTWSKDVDVEVVSTATTTRADSLVVGDEKCVKEFC